MLKNIALFIWVVVFCLAVNAGLSQTIITGGTTLKVTSGTTLNSSDHVTVQNSATLDNQGTVILKKNLVNQNATPNSLGSGTFIFSGTVNQSVSGQNIFGNLTLNNATGLTVGGNTRINGIFTLTSGVVTLGSNNLLLGPVATVAGTPSSANMVVATGSGQLRKEFPAGFSGIFTYPVGDATSVSEYSPVTLNFVSGTFGADNYAGVNLVNAQYAGTLNNYTNRYWNITQSNISNFSCVATFQYVPADVVGDESNMYCFRVDPLPFTAYSKANAGAHTLTAPGLTSFSTFTGNRGDLATPPATHYVGDVTTGSGQSLCFDASQTLVIAGNGTTFIVQSGGNVNLIAGEKIYLMPGTMVYAGGYLHGYIASNGQYCTVPSNPVVINPNEKSVEESNSNVIETDICRIYPNPTNGKFIIELSGQMTGMNVTVDILGMTGAKIFTKEFTGLNKQEFTLEGRPVGVYFVKVVSNGEVFTRKLILTR